MEKKEEIVKEEIMEEIQEENEQGIKPEKLPEKKVLRRRSGILCHPTSLPSPYGIGDLGKGAYDFVDFLQKAGQTLWQVLPLGPTGFGDSPYQSYSVFAGQTLLISPDLLAEQGLLVKDDLKELPEFDDAQVHYGDVLTWKTEIFEKAFAEFEKTEDEALLKEYEQFLAKHRFWLDDYAFYMAVREANGHQCWTEWEPALQRPGMLVRLQWETKLKKEIAFQKFLQFEFYKQWGELKKYANEKGVYIIGDMPIFVSADSSDVWAHKELFALDEKGYPLEIAGVPPDYFSATGQLWGNPLYDWEAHKKQGYRWWIVRIRTQLEQLDYLRIDHFRGFESYWAVPAGEETAVNGKWRKGPGEALFLAVQKELGEELPIFAEDLGFITPEVEKLRDRFAFPGMRVLQFGFEAWPNDSFYPHNFTTDNCICYTGTHDNDTTKGWYEHTTEEARDRVRRYMNCDGGRVSWDFIRVAMGSIARYAVFPLQDVLALGSEARMNVPGVLGANWAWRFKKEDLQDWQATELRLMSELFNR